MKTAIQNIARDFLSEAAASPRMFEDLAAMEKYMAESYDGRAFVEMLQNADDAGAKRVIVFSVGNDYVLANDGRPFNEQDLLSICRSGASSKQRGSGIGYRGVGFKSATSISTEIIIHSSDTFFTFSKSRCAIELEKTVDRVPTVRIPFPVSSNEISLQLNEQLRYYKNAGYTTFFIFKNANRDKLVAELSDANNGWMLFLNSVEQIQFSIASINRDLRIKRTRRNHNQAFISFEGTNENWLTVTDNNDVSIAFKYNEGIVACTPEEAVFHCYLPTVDSFGFPFKANADFSTDPSRKHVILNDDVTQRNLALIARLIADFVKRNVATEVNSGVLNLLATRVGLSEVATALDRQVFEMLSSEAWIPLRNGKHIRPSSAKILPNWIDEKSRRTIFEYVPSLANLEIHTSLQTAVDRLNILLAKVGALTYGVTEFTAILENVNAVAKLGDQFLGKLWAYTFRAAFYESKNLQNCYFTDLHKQIIRVADANNGKNLSDTFKKSLSAVLSQEELDKLIIAIPAFASIAENTNGKGVSGASSDKPMRDAKMSMSKWKTPVQNCIAAEALLGYTAKDVSRKNLGYDVISTNAEEKTRYLAVKCVNTMGDSFSLTDTEHSEAERLGDAYFVFVIGKSDPENENVLLSSIGSRSFEKRVKEWEWICTDYEAPNRKPDSGEYAVDSHFITSFSLKYLNKLQVEFLSVLLNKGEVGVFLRQTKSKQQVLVTQINSIADFYLGEELICYADDQPCICEKYLGGVRYLFDHV